MSILLAIVLGISTILVSQMKIVKGIESSVVAFYAAETGIEQVLINRANPCGTGNGDCSFSGILSSNGAAYSVEVLPDGDCPAANFCIKSVGSFRGVKRAIQVSY